MADQMSCLGFDFTDQGTIERFFDAHWSKKTVVDLDCGVYLRMNVEQGIVCWLSVDPDSHEVLDWDLHYAPAGAQGCAFDCDLTMDDAGQSGYIRVLLKPGTEDELPLTAACPALAFWPDREPGSPGLIRPAFYAVKVEPFDGDEALAADPEQSTAVVAGHVLSCERNRNAWSGNDYWHITLACRGLTLDLLCEQTAFDTVPAAGTMLRCETCVTAECEAGVNES